MKEEEEKKREGERETFRAYPMSIPSQNRSKMGEVLRTQKCSLKLRIKATSTDTRDNAGDIISYPYVSTCSPA